MACVRKKKNGSYEIIVSLGYNVEHKKITKSMIYWPEENMTEKSAKKEAERQAVLFEDKVIKRRVWRQNYETCRLYK